MKKHRFYHILTAIMLVVSQPMKAQFLPHSPSRETRAVWLTTFLGLDWPRTKSNDEMGIKRQKEELRELLDKLSDAGINTILFQTRVRGSVIYPSRIEPWDACFTGVPGKNPGYDPLAFAVEECHRRGMTIHAWVVALKVASNKYLDPSQPSTAQGLSDICCEIAENYDIDGISLDYIRYPEVASAINDKRRYKQNSRGLSYADWRRDNLTNVVRRVYKDIKAIKPWLWVTSSPVGKYADAAYYKAGGWNARNSVYQDVERWMREGIHDGLFPMMYFRGDNFYPFALQWGEMAQASGRLPSEAVCPGLGIYFMSPSEKDWPLTDITRELEFMRRVGMGQCYFRARFLTDNTKGLHDWLRLYHNRERVLPLPLPTTPDKYVKEVDSLEIVQYDFDCAKLIIHDTGDVHNIYIVSAADTVLVSPMHVDSVYAFSPRVLMSNGGKLGVKTMSKYGFESKMKVITLKSCEKIDSISEKSINFAAQFGNSLIFNSKQQ